MNTQTNTAAAMEPQMPPGAQLMNLVGACFVSQAVYVAAKLGLPDLLAENPQSVKALAEKTETHERSLYRLLRTLTSFGIFTEVEAKVFANTPMSEALITDAPNSLRDLTIWMGEEPHWRVYGEMLHSVKTGEAAWAKVHGEDVFPYLFHTNKELGEIFNRAMTSFAGQTIPAFLAAYDFSEAQVIADIAGGFGHLLAATLQKYPQAQGVLFDDRTVLEGAKNLLANEGVAERVELVGGDFFQSVPVKADIYMLKHIIHDWDDEKCVTILRNIAGEMQSEAKVLILDTVLPEGNEPHFGKVMDMEMLVSPGGIERTAEEFRQLLEDAGLKLNRIIPTQSPIGIVEAVKA